MKILIYDLEVAPNVSLTWGGSLYEQNVIAVQKNWEILSFAYKWLGTNEITCVTKQGQKTDKKVTEALHKIFDQADVVVAHNAIKFDNKKARAKFIEHGLTPPSPFKTIDTLRVARQQFSFNSNTLDALGKLLKVGRKLHNPQGFELWLAVMADDKKAWQQMIKYNVQDVELLEQVYLKLRPWIEKHPHAGLENAQRACPKCGGEALQRRGKSVSASGTYLRYQCMSCGGWSQEKTREAPSKARLKNPG